MRVKIETLYSHYAHTADRSHLDKTRETLQEKYPEYVSSYDRVMKQTYGYMFNMMIMQRDLLDKYCTWLFDILFELQKRIDTTEMTAFEKRLFGRVAERLLNIWLDYQLITGQLQKNEVIEIPYIHMEKVNWLVKGSAFLKAKFFNKKYEKSF